VQTPLAFVPFIFFRLCLTGSLIAFQLFAMFWFLSRTRMYTIWPGQEGVSFKDYRGQPELLEQARQVVQLLRGVRVFEQAGGEPLNGLLLEGPPGTGKTWLAQAISTEAGVPFFFVDASSLQAAFIGIAPLKIAGVYRKARRAAKEYGAAVIFMDEIDSIGSRGGVSRVREQSALAQQAEPAHAGGQTGRTTDGVFMGMGGSSMGLLSTLLIEMSGFSLEHGWRARLRTAWYRRIRRMEPPRYHKRVLTIGATNRVDALDPALLRPGRFDKKIHVDAPDLEGRRDIIEYYLSKMQHDESVDALVLASETPGYTPADLKYLLNEALRYALFDGRMAITYRDIRLAQPEHEMGLRTPIRNMTHEDKYRLAAHEAGHAIAIRVYRPHYRISRITIMRQGAALGHVWSYPAREEIDPLSTYEQLMNQLRVAVGGKAAELEFCGEGQQTLGVGGDFAQIRLVLTRMASTGMFGVMGASMNMAWGGNIPAEVQDTMDETFRMVLDDVRVTLRLHRAMGEALIALLLEKEELLADEVESFFDQYGFFTPTVELHPDREPVGTVVIEQPEQR
jgi:ATP-dependent Zn protease